MVSLLISSQSDYIFIVFQLPPIFDNSYYTNVQLDFTTLIIRGYSINASLENPNEGVIAYFHVNFIDGSMVTVSYVTETFLSALVEGDRIGDSVVIPSTLEVYGCK